MTVLHTAAIMRQHLLVQQQPLMKQPESKGNAATPEPSSIFDQLGALPLPDREINDILNHHETLSLDDVIQRLDNIVRHMTGWLETAQMAVFTLEMEAKDDMNKDNNMSNDAGSLLELSFGRIEPFVSILNEINDIVIDKLDDHESDNAGDKQQQSQRHYQQKKLTTRMTINKIQSEWSGLQCCLASVLHQLDNALAEKELTALMEHVLQQIDDLLTTIFQVQERRHMYANNDMNTPLPPTADNIDAASTTTTESDQALIDIDNRIEPLFNQVQRIYTAMTSNNPPADASGVLGRVHHKIQHRWEALRTEVDYLKQELKEERWLNVFRQVADQVDVMIDGLEKTVSQCYDVVHQAQQSHIEPPPGCRRAPLVDRKKYEAAEKSFEAKHKYYTPSIDKMLGMLQDGIVAKMQGDNATTRRFDGMKQRWLSLKGTMERLITRDLPETGRLIVVSHDVPHVMHNDVNMGARILTRQARLGSVDAAMDHRLRRSMSPSSRETPVAMQHQQRRPSSSLGREAARLRPSASESSLLNPSARRNGGTTRRTKTPLRNNNGIPPSGAESISSGDSLSTSSSRRADPSWLLEPPKNMPGRRTQSVDHGVSPNRPRTPVRRSKTPSSSDLRKSSRTPITRPKSSMSQHHANEDDSYHMTTTKTSHTTPPARRSMTPSFIPRPKTPTSRQQQPSLIPRPQSSMLFCSPSSSTDETLVHSSSPAPERSTSSRIRKKHSMPSLRTSRATHVPKTSSKQHHQHSSSYDYYHHHHPTDIFGSNNSNNSKKRESVYRPNARDALDVEVARIVNACPIRIKCQRGPSNGQYYFGNDLNLGGRKLYTCKLMNYADRETTRRPSTTCSKENKVLVRVGGGWQDLEMFLLEHSNLMAATQDVITRPYTSMGYRHHH
ncbi:hypothetical protein O0I10_002186 [Lichtheimia ornata]|uniref:GAR domain-containing protein n=1 Tax=Lichtheimia ornata TaxID=688661 RepID=A0AAD7VA67_9FUNG|nr:uncharacterized protein O0I10_002186 [Lichtheimia ornata]KAJ8661857.1 hypothetical protein O0I10_002186 [Lichtheimia ornata]